MAMERLTPDRLPVPPPPGPTRSLYQPFFGTPMGGLPSQPIPVTLPNDLNLFPGDKAELWYYDAAPFPNVPGQWRMAGMGTVSADGTKIVSDPGVGIERFCGVCGLSCFISRLSRQLNRCFGGCTGGNPVDLFLGQTIPEQTDLTLQGRIPAVIHRTYNPFDPFGGIAGFQLGLGAGWALSVDIVLLPETAQLRTLVMPGNARLSFVLQSDGTFINTTHPAFAGAVLSAGSGGEHSLRLKNGTVWRFVPGTAGLGLLVEQRDRNGNRLLIERSGNQITRIVEPAGRALVFSYTGSRISSIRDPLGREVQYSYNTSGRLETVADPEGGETQYSYDTAGRILSITNARGIVQQSNSYDAQGRVVSERQADGGTWSITYLGPAEAPTGAVEVDPRGNSATYRWGPRGFLREVTDALGQTRTFERDPATDLLLTVKGNASCDACGNPSTGDGTATYDDNGNVKTRTDALGHTTTFSYEPIFNNVTSIRDPLGHVTNFTYDSNGNLKTRTDENGHTTTFAYDQFGQLTESADPLNEKTTFTYDGFGNLASITDALGKTTSFRYDALSRPIETTDTLGRKSATTYDNLDRVKIQRDAKNRATTFTYDAVGNLLSVTDARNNTTSFTYDSRNRLATRTTPLGKADTRHYDVNGNLIEFTSRRGLTSRFEYDELNQLVQEVYDDGSMVERQYDVQGRLLRADDSVSGSFMFTYDLVGRTTSATSPFGTVEYQYDALDRVTSRQVVGQPPVDYDYDPVGNLLRAATLQAAVNFTYDARDQLRQMNRSNGVSSTYNYDPVGRVLSLTHANGATVLNTQTYTYDDIGNRTSYTTDIAQPLITQPVANSCVGRVPRAK